MAHIQIIRKECLEINCIEIRKSFLIFRAGATLINRATVAISTKVKVRAILRGVAVKNRVNNRSSKESFDFLIYFFYIIFIVYHSFILHRSYS